MQIRFLFPALIYWLLSFSASTVVAQQKEITGKVINTGTLQPVPHIRIQIEGSSLSFKTNINGRFKITIPDTIDFPDFIDSPGLKIQETKKVQENTYDIYVSELSVQDLFAMSFEELFNIPITTAGKKEEKIAGIPASVVIVTRDEIEHLGYSSVQEILENVPGIYTIDNYSSNDVSLGVRGFWAPFTRNVVIMVNGVDMKQDKYAHYPLNKINVPIEAIDKIEVIRGPMSVIYGSGAAFGAINIITNDINYESKSIVSATIGTSNTKKLVARITGKGDQYKFAMNASAYETNGLNTDFSKMSSNPYFLGAKTTDFFNNSHFYLNFSGSYKDFYTDISGVRSDKPWYFKYVNKYVPNKKTSDFFTYRLGYNKKLSNSITLNTKFGYYSTNIKSGIVWPYHPTTGEEIRPSTHQQLMHSAWSLFSASYDIEINTVFTPSDKVDITLGLYYKKLLESSERDELPTLNFYGSYIEQPFDRQLKTYAGFTQVNFNVSDNIKMVAGLRLEKNGKGKNIWPIFYTELEQETISNKYSLGEIDMPATDIQVIPRFAFIYSPIQNNTIKLLYGKAVRMPSYIENNDIFLYPGNKAIEPERVHTIEANFSSLIAANTTFSLSVYRNILENLIYRKEWMENGNYLAETTNEGEMSTNGIEFTVQTRPTEKLDMNISLTYQDTKDINNPSREVMCSPELLGYGKFSYLLNQDLSFSCRINYVSKMVSQWDISKLNTDGSLGARTGFDSPSYLNMGINIRTNNLFNNTGLYMNINLSNVLNEEIRYPTYSAGIWADKGTLGKGRTFLFSLGYKF